MSSRYNGRYDISTGKFENGKSWSSVLYRNNRGTLKCHPRSIDWEERYNDNSSDDEYDSEEEKKLKREEDEALDELQDSTEFPFFNTGKYHSPRDKDGNPEVPKSKDLWYRIVGRASFNSSRNPMDTLSLIEEALKDLKTFSFKTNKEEFEVTGWNNNSEQCLQLGFGSEPVQEFIISIYDNEDGTYIVDIVRQADGDGIDIINILGKCKTFFGISE